MLTPRYFLYLSFVLLALLMAFLPNYLQQPNPQRLEDTRRVAVEFLDLVDAGHYRQSWDGCADYLRTHVSIEQWLTQLGGARQTVGKLLERKETRHSYSSAGEKGLPEGEYMVYAYVSRFSDKDEVREMVTLHQGEDQTWRVAGYFIE